MAITAEEKKVREYYDRVTGAWFDAKEAGDKRREEEEKAKLEAIEFVLNALSIKIDGVGQ